MEMSLRRVRKGLLQPRTLDHTDGPGELTFPQHLETAAFPDHPAFPGDEQCRRKLDICCHVRVVRLGVATENPTGIGLGEFNDAGQRSIEGFAQRERAIQAAGKVSKHPRSIL